MSSPSLPLAAQTLGITTSLIASGGILTLSLFTAQNLKSQEPRETTLQNLRFTFSRGSHIFPPLSAISAAAFSYLAYTASLASTQAPLVRLASNSVPKVLNAMTKRDCYIAAAVACFSIMPFTVAYMVPKANGRLLELMDKKEEGKGVQASEEEITELLERFDWMNNLRGIAMGLGGVVGLVAALA